MPVILLVTTVAVLYALGAYRLSGRFKRGRRGLRHRLLAMGGALLALGAALSSPLHHLAMQLFSAHMVQHLLLMLVAAPLLVLARPMQIMIWSLPRRGRKRLRVLWHQWRAYTILLTLIRPASTWTLFCATLVLWHTPAIYRWAFTSESAHLLMQATFLVSSLLFWSTILAPPSRASLSYTAKALFVFTAALVTGLPGALIAFAPLPLYMIPAGAMRFNLTPLADQQLAGLIMWIPMDLILFTVAVVLLGLALSSRINKVLPLTPTASLVHS